jgi:sugar lactone lactonase YvrE
VIKFSPEGRVLLTLGKPGGAAAPDYFFQPDDVIVGNNGDIFVGEGHGGGNSRVLKFDRTGKFIKAWGKLGAGQGELNQPHALAIDAQGRLFVADRTNNRVQVFDQDGKFLAETKAFGRPSGVYIDKNDNLYVADSESQSRNADGYGYNPGVKRGIRIGSAKTLTVTGFIPDPSDGAGGTSAAEGVAVDTNGVVYGAEVGPRALKRYVK